MNFLRIAVVAVATMQVSGFFVPVEKRPFQRSTSDFRSRSKSENGALHMAGDPIESSFVLSNLPLLLAPITALAAGLASLNQRNEINDEIATTEMELNNIKKRLESSNLQINVSLFLFNSTTR
jgi:hypothetical protein